MPGLRKTVIAEHLHRCIDEAGASVDEARFVGPRGSLPWRCRLTFSNLSERTFDFYLWTVSHGGRRRRTDEYRIQTKLDQCDSLGVASGTTILGGYYTEAVDRSGREAGNSPPPDMEVFVFWDATEHLDLGHSSSCQVPFGTLYEAYIRGHAANVRSLGSGREETVVAVRPEYVVSYLQAASGGHQLLIRMV